MIITAIMNYHHRHHHHIWNQSDVFQICEANRKFTSQPSTSVKRKDLLFFKTLILIKLCLTSRSEPFITWTITIANQELNPPGWFTFERNASIIIAYFLWSCIFLDRMYSFFREGCLFLTQRRQATSDIRENPEVSSELLLLASFEETMQKILVLFKVH